MTKPIKASEVQLGAELTPEQRQVKAAAMAVRQRRAKREALHLAGIMEKNSGAGSADLHDRVAASEAKAQERMAAWRNKRGNQ